MKRRWVGGIAAAVVVVIVLIAWVVQRRGGAQASPPPSASPSVSASPTEPAITEIPDQYYPDLGNGGYQVTHYDAVLTWNQKKGVLTGKSTISATATKTLASFSLDFYGDLKAVKVDGKPAKATESGKLDWIVAHPIYEGSDFVVETTFQVDPAKDCAGSAVLSKTQVVIADEPGGATCFMPSNDHPSDPATYSFELRAPKGEIGIGPGKLIFNEDGVTKFEVSYPVPAYATSVAFGNYTLKKFDGSWSAFDESLPEPQMADSIVLARQSPSIKKRLTDLFGEYPADSAGALVTSLELPYGALEVSGRPVYTQFVTTETIGVHELSHMWLGDKITLASWDDLWLNEGMATYTQWVYAERYHTDWPETAQQAFDLYVSDLDADPQHWQDSLLDQTAEGAPFTMAVYNRGALTMHALRNVMGDDVFFPFWKKWAQRSGPASTEDFIAAAEEASGKDLDKFFKAWLEGTTEMPHTPEYGFK